jgi:hypothetical protein
MVRAEPSAVDWNAFQNPGGVVKKNPAAFWSRRPLEPISFRASISILQKNNS